VRKIATTATGGESMTILNSVKKVWTDVKEAWWTEETTSHSSHLAHRCRASKELCSAGSSYANALIGQSMARKIANAAKVTVTTGMIAQIPANMSQ
jgi:hypothetical protein